MSDVPTPNLNIDTAEDHTLVFTEGGTLEVDGTPVEAGTPSEITAAGATTVTVSQTGTGAIHIVGNTTGGVELNAGASTGAVAIGTADNLIGFFGADPVAQQDGSGVTTVAEVLTLLENLGLVHS